MVALTACGPDGALPTEQSSREIVGGSVATPGDWPFQVQLRYNGGHWCGGSVLDERFVLTAAHCVQGRSTSSLSLRYGVHDRNNPGTHVLTRGVANIHVHPSYNSATFDNDVAVLEADAPVTIGPHIQPVVLRTTDPAVGTNAFVTGWGRTGAGAPASSVLKQAMLPIEATATCNGAGTLPLTVTGSMVCAGYVGGEHGGCHGDSGGPLVVPTGYSGGWEQVGIVSWGVGYYCSSYTVFARISQFVPWIDGITGPIPIPGDADGSGCVDQADYDLIGAHYNSSPAHPAADLNGDGAVNYGDLLIVIQNWGAGCTP
jgi:integrin beta 3